MPRILGVDLGNAKLKLVALETQGDRPVARWGAFPLPFTAAQLPDRRADFEAGLSMAVAAFDPDARWDRVVVATSHFYSYPSFRHALSHTAELIAQLWGPAARLLGAEGRLYPAEASAQHTGREVLRFAATKFWGSAFLASKLIPDGISVDVGTTSTDVIALRGGAIEPSAPADPDGFNLSRLETQRLMWYGMTASPLEYVARLASTGGRSYHLYPRGATTEVLTRLLDLVPEARARLHAYANQYPSREAALWGLAQAFGLDRDLLSEAELVDLAANLHRQLIARVAEGIARVVALAGLGEVRSQHAVVMGLGKDALAKPALLACGVAAARILDLEDVLGAELAAASTAYGAAWRGLEDLVGPLPLPRAVRA